MNPKHWLIAFLIILNGAWLGLGLYTFKYAKGFSYLSSDPKVCANCHIMQPQYDGWVKSSHHQVATCVDCHLPHSFVKKYLAKMENGYFHSKAFTLQNFHEPIRITPKNSRILEDSCKDCHQSLLEETLLASPKGGNDASAHHPSSNCTHCHANVGHGEQAAMGKAY